MALQYGNSLWSVNACLVFCIVIPVLGIWIFERLEERSLVVRAASLDRIVPAAKADLVTQCYNMPSKAETAPDIADANRGGIGEADGHVLTA